MKNLVIKTALITLVGILGVALVLYGVFALFIPKPLANFYDSVNNYKLSVKYYEKQYQKTDDIYDLYQLAVKINQNKEGNKAQTVLETLVKRSDYLSFCQKQDQKLNSNISSREFIEGKYLCVVYSNLNIVEAISVGNELLENSEYTKFNCFNTLILNYGSQFDDAEIESLIDNIAVNYDTANLNVMADINLLNSLKD